MPEHAVGTREEWLRERVALLVEEKELTARAPRTARAARAPRTASTAPSPIFRRGA